MTPLVSVLLPTYGRPEMLPGAVRSVLAQTYTSLELLVGIDGDPRTNEAARDLPSDPRLHVHTWERNRGQFAVNEDLLAASKGDYVCVFSDDDLMEPRFLEASVSSLERSGADYAYADQFLWAEDTLTPRCGLNMNATVFRREALERIRAAHGHVFEPRLRQYGDAVLLERLGGPRAKAVHVHEPLIRYRIHPAQITMVITFRQILDQLHAANLTHRSLTVPHTARMFLWLVNRHLGNPAARLRGSRTGAPPAQVQA